MIIYKDGEEVGNSFDFWYISKIVVN